MPFGRSNRREDNAAQEMENDGNEATEGALPQEDRSDPNEKKSPPFAALPEVSDESQGLRPPQPHRLTNKLQYSRATNEQTNGKKKHFSGNDGRLSNPDNEIQPFEAIDNDNRQNTPNDAIESNQIWHSYGNNHHHRISHSDDAFDDDETPQVSTAGIPARHFYTSQILPDASDVPERMVPFGSNQSAQNVYDSSNLPMAEVNFALSSAAQQQQDNLVIDGQLIRHPSFFRSMRKWILLFFMLAILGVIILIVVGPTKNLSSTPSNEAIEISVPTPNPTSSPTFAPSSSKFLVIKDIVENKTQNVVLNDMLSPQFRAIWWLAYEDKYEIDLSNDISVLERFALATVYFATGGEDAWGVGQCNFLINQHVCDWKKVSKYYSELYGGFFFCGAVCDSSQTHVTTLRIEPHTANGTIPEEIAFLSKLQWFEIDYNHDLVGSLPQSIGKMENLAILSLDVTGLNGPLPSSLGNLSQLLMLSLSANAFNGTIPSTLGQLHNLQYLTFSMNLLTGTIPTSFGNLTNLESFSLTNNYLSGTLPLKEDGTTQMSWVGVGNNILEGAIPDAIFTFSRLYSFDINDNLFSGIISPNIALLPKLEYLNLQNNNFSGWIPSSIGTLINLKRLFLFGNKFSGTIPKTLGNLSNLLELFLFQNQLSGSIPSEIGQLHHLESLSLGLNPLTGQIPEMLGNLVQLQWLSLANSRVNGTIPSSFSNFQLLRVFMIQWTDLSGDMDFLSHLQPFSLAMANCRGVNPDITCTICTVCCADGEGCFLHGSDTPFNF